MIQKLLGSPYVDGGWKVFSGAVGSGIWTAYEHGEIMNWHGLMAALSDSALPAVVLTLVWLFLRSPRDSQQLSALQAELERLKAQR